ncbi:MAG: polyprenyl synthetase family protein [Fusobacterium perfoetens]|uniref:polyprenyl synthetase family protein n=1 Tax=Fusobacterium perfoetens TaxID=852 RepID=UPI0023F00378|nr:farnesyl diphosphate synthase [Fusobacterium perfoetens]MCI6152093.1 polyprenyl synthetase family protein [Fusobacterium perfoetens]MDY3238016.1 farnesyl diphosphate synthase [Fusobacterium perfoetens]
MLKDYLNQKKEILENKVNEYLSDLEYPWQIADGMKYAILNGGKRIRPILLFMILDLFNKDEKFAYPTAVGLEMIHSYSLVHDDLPALDNDDYRRGKLTTHKKFGEAEGILIGDALLTHAFNIFTEKNIGLLSSEKIVEIVRLTSSYAGINGMIGGQMIDIESEGKKIDMETLKYIHKNKTGKLLRLPIEFGCIIADVPLEIRKKLEEFADLIGLAFQIKDDILDIEGDFDTLGKPIGSDVELEKSTYPSLIGLVESKKLLIEITENAKNIIKNNFSEEKGKLLIELADYIAFRKK